MEPWHFKLLCKALAYIVKSLIVLRFGSIENGKGEGKELAETLERHS
jgi:hypothetical protein